MNGGRPLELKREAVDILLEQWKIMDADRKKRTDYEQAVVTLYELILYHETVKMEPDDADAIEDAADKHRPHPEHPEPPAIVEPPPEELVEPPPEATQLPA